MTKPFHDFRVFLGALVRRPGAVGAIAPSGTALATLLASVVPTTDAPVVVELGPGTGAISKAIHRRLPTDARHLAVELDSTLVKHLSERYPHLEVIHGNAADLGKLLSARGIDRVDAVISGLPWALFDGGLQRDILEQIGVVLAEGAAFTTFAYVHALPLGNARRFARLLRASFDEVIVSRVVWANLPPAICYVCRRPRVSK